MINLYLLSNIFPIYRELWSKELLKKFIRNDYNLVTIVDCLEQDLVVKNINKLLLWLLGPTSKRIHGGRDRMVVGFTTTCAINAYHH